MKFKRSDFDPTVVRNEEDEVVDVQIVSSIAEVSKRYAFHDVIRSSSGFSNHFIVEDFDLPLEEELEETLTLFYLRQSFFTDKEEYLAAKGYYQRLLSYSSSKFVKSEFQTMNSMYFNESEARGFYEIVEVFGYGEADQIDVQRIEPVQIDQFIKSIIMLLMDCKTMFNLHHSNISLSNIVLTGGELKISGFKSRHVVDGVSYSWKASIIGSLGPEKLDLFLIGALWMTFLGKTEVEELIKSTMDVHQLIESVNKVFAAMDDFEKKYIVSDLLDLKSFKITCLSELVSELDQFTLLKNVQESPQRRLTNVSSEFSPQSLSNIFQRTYQPSVSIPDDGLREDPNIGEPLLNLNDDNFTLYADGGGNQNLFPNLIHKSSSVFEGLSRIRRATEAQSESERRIYSERRMTLDSVRDKASFPSHKNIIKDTDIKEDIEAEENINDFDSEKGHSRNFVFGVNCQSNETAVLCSERNSLELSSDLDHEETPQQITTKPTPHINRNTKAPKTQKDDNMDEESPRSSLESPCSISKINKVSLHKKVLRESFSNRESQDAQKSLKDPLDAIESPSEVEKKEETVNSDVTWLTDVKKDSGSPLKTSRYQRSPSIGSNISRTSPPNGPNDRDTSGSLNLEIDKVIILDQLNQQEITNMDNLEERHRVWSDCSVVLSDKFLDPQVPELLKSSTLQTTKISIDHREQPFKMESSMQSVLGEAGNREETPENNASLKISGLDSIKVIQLHHDCSDKVHNQSSQNSVKVHSGFKEPSDSSPRDLFSDTNVSQTSKKPTNCLEYTLQQIRDSRESLSNKPDVGSSSKIETSSNNQLPVVSSKSVRLSKIALFEVPVTGSSEDNLTTRETEQDSDLAKLKANAFKKKELMTPISPYYKIDEEEQNRIVEDFKETFVALSKESSAKINSQREYLRQKELERLNEERVIQQRIDRQLEINLKKKKQRAEEQAMSRLDHLKKSEQPKKSKKEVFSKSHSSNNVLARHVTESSCELETPRTLTKQITQRKERVAPVDNSRKKECQHPNPERAFAETVSKLRSHLEGSASSYKEKYLQYSKKHKVRHALAKEISPKNEQGVLSQEVDKGSGYESIGPNPFTEHFHDSHDFDSATSKDNLVPLHPNPSNDQDDQDNDRFFVSEKVSGSEIRKFDLCSNEIIFRESIKAIEFSPLNPSEGIIQSTLTFGQEYQSLTNFTSIAKTVDHRPLQQDHEIDLGESIRRLKVEGKVSELEALLPNHSLSLETRNEILQILIDLSTDSSHHKRLETYLQQFQELASLNDSFEDMVYISSVYLIINKSDQALQVLAEASPQFVHNSVVALDVFSKALIAKRRLAEALPVLGRLIELLISSPLEDAILDYLSSTILTFVQILEIQKKDKLVIQLLDSVNARLKSFGESVKASFGSNSFRTNQLLVSVLVKYIRSTFNNKEDESQVHSPDDLCRMSRNQKSGLQCQINTLFNDSIVSNDLETPLSSEETLNVFNHMMLYLSSIVKPMEFLIAKSDLQLLSTIVIGSDCNPSLLMYIIEVVQYQESSPSIKYTLFLLMVKKAELFFKSGDLPIARQTLMIALDLTSFCTELLTDENLAVLLYDISVCALSDNDFDEAVFFLKSARTSTGILTSDFLMRILVLEIKLRIQKQELVEEELLCLQDEVKKSGNKKFENILDCLAVLSGNTHLISDHNPLKSLYLLIDDLNHQVGICQSQDWSSLTESRTKVIQDLLQVVNNDLLPVLKFTQGGCLIDFGVLIRSLTEMLMVLSQNDIETILRQIKDCDSAIQNFEKNKNGESTKEVCLSIREWLAKIEKIVTLSKDQTIAKVASNNTNMTVNDKADVEKLKKSLTSVFQKSNYRRKLRCQCFDYSKKHIVLSKLFGELGTSLRQSDTTTLSLISQLTFIEKTLASKKSPDIQKYRYYALLLRVTETSFDSVLNKVLLTSNLCIHDIENIILVIEIMSRSESSSIGDWMTRLYLIVDCSCPSLLKVIFDEVVTLRFSNLLGSMYDRLEDKHVFEQWLYPFNDLVPTSDQTKPASSLTNKVTDLQSLVHMSKESKQFQEISKSFRRAQYSIAIPQERFIELSACFQSFVINVTLCKALINCAHVKQLSFIEVVDSLVSMLESFKDPDLLHPLIPFSFLIFGVFIPPNFILSLFSVLAQRLVGTARFYLSLVGSWLATLSMREQVSEVCLTFVRTSLSILGSIEKVDLTFFPDFVHKVTPQAVLFNLLTTESVTQLLKESSGVAKENLQFLKNQSTSDVNLQLLISDLEFAIGAIESTDEVSLENLRNQPSVSPGAICSESSKNFRQSLLKSVPRQ
jgi:hypothetical protein